MIAARLRGLPTAGIFAGLLGIAAFASGCPRETSAVREGPQIGEIGPDTVVGTVRRVGSLPFASTIIEGVDRSVTVIGEMEPQLARLVGAEVLVAGRLGTGEGRGPHLEAISYTILSVDGERPTLGTLERDDRGWLVRSADGGELRLSALSDRLAEAEGGLVWVILDSLGGVARYGILREP